MRSVRGAKGVSTDDTILSDHPNPPQDSLSSTSSEPARESVTSFWIACAGLAVLAHVVSTGGYLFIPHYDSWIISALFDSISQEFWDAFLSFRLLAGAAFTPSVVIVCLTPILYWRGRLVHRFVLSLVIAITVLNVTGDLEVYVKYKFRWNQVGMIVACWVALPLIFIWTPIKTRQLRLIVASGVLLLTFCLSMLHLYASPPNDFFLCWMSLYAAAFSITLLRRNWGRVAMLEKGTTPLQIETTSTRTLLELMVVAGLACSAASYWSIREEENAWLSIAGAATLGFMIAMVSIASIRITLGPTSYWIPKLLGLWCLTTVLFSTQTLLVTLVDRSRWGQLDRAFWENFLYWPQLYFILFTSMLASLAFLVLALGVGYWLRWCGWRVDCASGTAVAASQSFNELD